MACAATVLVGAGSNNGATRLQRPAPAGGPMRFSRPGRGRERGMLRAGALVLAPCNTARSGASESLVTWPAHTRSHNAANVSPSVALGVAMRTCPQKLAPRSANCERMASWTAPVGGSGCSMAGASSGS